MSEQLLAFIDNTVQSALVRWDSLLYLVGIQRFPPQSCREIRTGPNVTFSREYLSYTNAFTLNDVNTAKYNVFTFLPRALFEQFRRVANLYFLLISVLMTLGTYTEFFDSPLDPWSTLFPLFVVIGVSMAKEGAEDLKRHRGDRETNNCPALILSKDMTTSEERQGHHLVATTAKTTATASILKSVYWSEIQVGDLLYLKNNDKIPADVILLTSSDEASGSGVVYIETANIDGETNLKIRVSALAAVPGSKEEVLVNKENRPGHWFPIDVQRADLVIQCDHPNSSIHSFKGSVQCNANPPVAVDSRHLLLRGSQLCNTTWAVGVVVYTGHQSKLVLNSRKVPSKLSFMERTMNKLVSVIFAAHVAVSLIALMCFIVWTTYHYDVLGYLCFQTSHNPNIDPIYENCKETNEYSHLGYFFTFYILFNNFVPISLYVTCETVNYVQAYFIDNDVSMYDSTTNIPTVARTSNMNGDLGMIEYLFSDKTGTLTQNLMVFNRCSVGGVIYYADPEDMRSAKEAGHFCDNDEQKLDEVTVDCIDKHEGQHNNADSDRNRDKDRNEDASINGQKKCTLVHEPLDDLLCLATKTTANPLDKENSYAQFVFVLSVAHTVVLDPVTYDYMAESPDEEALVKAGRDLGWEFTRRDHNTVEVTSTLSYRQHQQRQSVSSIRSPNILSFVILATIPFDSTRKRMSVVVQFSGCEGAVVLSKGADNVMLERAVEVLAAHRSQHTNTTGSSEDILKSHLNEFATHGLRTLLIAKRHISKSTLQTFLKKWKAAETAMVNRESLLEEAAALIEKEFTILGATAIEDKLQENVPETIEALRIAGIKVWVLTGDKVETAINIGFSCRLLGPEMIIIKLQDSDDGGDNSVPALKSRLDSLLKQIKKCANVQYNAAFASEDSHPASSNAPKSSSDGFVDLADIANVSLSSEHLALVVDGVVLTQILGSVTLRGMFLELACMCKAVLACRVSPEQKRLLVRLVKLKNQNNSQPTPVTLAIGDGANDVAMIQEAQVGVGISGREGRQAVNNADFALPQFQFLKRLLLVHGRTDYRRVSKVVLFSFYKNIVLTITMFLFTFHSAVSGQSLYDGYLYSSYNFILALPVVAFGIFDQDLSPKMLEKYPLLYITSREKRDMNISILIRMTLQAIVEGAMIFYSVYWAFEDNNGRGDDGLGGDIWVFGTSVYTALIITQIMRCVWLTYTWNYISVLFILISVGIYFTFLSSYQYFMFFDNFFRVTSHVLQLRILWVIALLVPITAILMEVFCTALIREYSPDILSVCIEHDRGYGHRYRHNNLTPSASGTTMSPFYQSLSEEMSCFFELEAMDNSRAGMLQDESGHSLGYYSDDSGSGMSLNGRSTSSVFENEAGVQNGKQFNRNPALNEADPDELLTATLVEGLRPRVLQSRHRKIRPHNRGSGRSGDRKRSHGRQEGHIRTGGYSGWRLWRCCRCTAVRECLLRFYLRLEDGVFWVIGSKDKDEGGERDGRETAKLYRLDWSSVRSMYLAMMKEDTASSGTEGAGEKVASGNVEMKNTDDRMQSSFNYDFVATDYGPGAARFFSKAYDNSVGLVVQKIQNQFQNSGNESNTGKKSGNRSSNLHSVVSLDPPGLDLSSHLQSLRNTQRDHENESKATELNFDDNAILLSFDDDDDSRIQKNLSDKSALTVEL